MKIARAREINAACVKRALLGTLFDTGEVPLPGWTRQEMHEAARRVREGDRLQLVGRRHLTATVDERVIAAIVDAQGRQRPEAAG